MPRLRRSHPSTQNRRAGDPALGLSVPVPSRPAQKEFPERNGVNGGMTEQKKLFACLCLSSFLCVTESDEKTCCHKPGHRQVGGGIGKRQESLFLLRCLRSSVLNGFCQRLKGSLPQRVRTLRSWCPSVQANLSTIVLESPRSNFAINAAKASGCSCVVR